ncbi:Rieske (2Fe-2S) protein [Actinopolyspora mortivallis]|uniref:Cytochrome bc1 complex Rieske iron-sulfur subunit n=1 Tax=Actinopolyspora mortivallis TaxID=33906 RepID=A0A2T0GZT3_ACTMO|nr:Rieske (2Fe-2S) protein [Actinopolyspora mortivallis]PRW64618.1 ferredoxin [Actinopolyspora mortivallis]
MSAEPPVTRRHALAVGGVGVGAAMLSGCSDGSYQGSELTSEERPSDGDTPREGERLAALTEVPVGGSLVVDGPEGEKIALSRPNEDEVTAHSAVCTHMRCTVRAAGNELRCPCHGSVFESASGEVVSGPARKPLPSVAVRVESGEIVTGGS